MNLENIGFYTLSDARAKQSSLTSPLWRCELLLTDKCNFSCPYCRGMRKDLRGVMSWEQALKTCQLWVNEGLKNVRFSGGEPTMWPHLAELVQFCKDNKVERIAISTNGSASLDYYDKLIDSGVNDFSISLDSCCASEGDKMAGGIYGVWEKVVKSIRHISSRSYLTVGMVFTEDNVANAAKSVLFADSLGVSDIRVVPSAQFNEALVQLKELPKEILAKYPILSYRINNLGQGRNVRKMCKTDCHKCHLAIDDMAVAGEYHFPCIIYMREGGNPIGKVGPNMRQERADWIESHNSFNDPICREMCLDVCIDYNNKANKSS